MQEIADLRKPAVSQRAVETVENEHSAVAAVWGRLLSDKFSRQVVIKLFDFHKDKLSDVWENDKKIYPFFYSQQGDFSGGQFSE